MPRITLWGIMQYDPSLFDNVILPDGLNKEILISEIMSRSGDLYPYYQVPTILKQNVQYWFLRRKFDFEQMYKALTMEYNPIENYNRYEVLSRDYENSGSDNTSRNYQNTNESTGSVINNENQNSDLLRQTDTEHGLKTTTENKTSEEISAYNSSSLQPRNATVTDQVVGNSGNDKTTSKDSNVLVSKMDSSSTDNSISKSSDNSTIKYGAIRNENENNHVHGNIGVTTTQAMIQSEIDLRIENDLYAMIAAMFENEFIIQIY